MLDKFQKCPYCEKKTCFLVCGYIGEPGGDYVRCYRCKRAWRTNWAHLTKHAPDAVESAASVGIFPASEVSASEAGSTPATTQVM
jgi:hypothetical protein